MRAFINIVESQGSLKKHIHDILRAGDFKIFGVFNKVRCSKSEDGNLQDYIFSTKKPKKAIGAACMEKTDGGYRTKFCEIEGEDSDEIKRMFYKRLMDDGSTLIFDDRSDLTESLETDGIDVSFSDGRVSLRTKLDELDTHPRVGYIPPQPPVLNRCTTISCNAILHDLGRPQIRTAAEVPETASESFDVLMKHGLNVQLVPDPPRVSVAAFVNTHRYGAWYIGTPGHAMAVVDGALYDAEHKGLDGRLVHVVAEVTR